MKKFLTYWLCFLGVLAMAGEASPIPGAELKLRPECSVKDGIYTVKIYEYPGIENEMVGVSWRIPLDRYAGRTICISAEMRTEGVGSDVKGQHVGAKILLTSVVEGGGVTWNFSKIYAGTLNEWQKVAAVCTVPASGIKSITACFGLQQAWGKAEFRNLSVEELQEDVKFTVPEGYRCEYTDKVARMPAMRGFMSPPQLRLNEQDIRDIGKLKGNLIRFQIVDGLSDINNMQEYERWMDSSLDRLETLMPVMQQCGIKVLIDMHRVPGGNYARPGMKLGTAGAEAALAYGNTSRFQMMEEPKWRECYLKIWRKIATRFKGNPVVYGYDLMNEPCQNGPARFSFLDLQYDAAKEIREIDPEMPIIVEGNSYASPTAFFSMKPLPLKNIIYSIHMYDPGEYTHQGVGDSKYQANFPKYCLDYHAMGLNRENLKNRMQLVRDFQQKYGARIFVGEFSVTIWSPGAADYLDDLISIFEEYQWDWTYHAFREWEGWSVEHSGTPAKIVPDNNTDRKQVLQKYLKRNQ